MSNPLLKFVKQFSGTNALTPAQIYTNAFTKGCEAVAGRADGYPCGFATVTIRPARGEFVKWCKENKIGRIGYNGGWTLSSYECSSFKGQNMYVKEDGCRAFADFLKAHGLKASVTTRMD